MVVVGLGEGHGEAKGDGWQDPLPRFLWAGPSTTSVAGTGLGGDRVALCSVLSGLDGIEEVDEEEVEESEKGAGAAGGSSEARETLNLPSLISPVGAGVDVGQASSREKGIGCPVFEGI